MRGPGLRGRQGTAGVAAVLVLLGGCSGGGSVGAPSPAPEASASAAAPSASPSTAPLAWSPCADGFSCAALAVPVDEDDATSGTIDLALTRRPAAGPGKRLGSLVVNPGGPGFSAVDFLHEYWSVLPEAVRGRFDLVAFDPRGVGGSSPVDCATREQLDRYFSLDPSPDDESELAALVEDSAALARGCAERSGALLPQVATEVAAADLDRVRAAVGDERLTYLGYSYGTALGAAYLDRFPDRVRAMVFDGAMDPTLPWDEVLAGQARGFDRAFEDFLADCERTGCSYRDAVDGPLGAAFDRLVARVDARPLPTDDGRTVGPGELVIGVSRALYSHADWPTLADALASAEQGDGGLLLALSDDYLGRGPEGYTSTQEALLAVTCVDRRWPRDPARHVALAERVSADAPRFGEAVTLAGLACAAWPVPPTGEPQRVSGEGAPTVVVLGTTNDPATPYAWAQGLAEQLSATLITFEGEGHTVYFEGAPECVRRPVDEYLLSGVAPEARRC